MSFHVLPVNDLEEHEEETTCKCEPRLEIVNGEMLIIHNAFDQREILEITKEMLMTAKIKTLEEYFRGNIENGIIDFTIRASNGSNGIEFYIHPSGKDGETLDFWIEGDTLISRNSYDGSTRIIRNNKGEQK